MKSVLIILTIFVSSLNAFGQKADFHFKSGQIELGYIYLSNSLNNNNYYNFKYNGLPDIGETSMSGLNLKFSMPTKHQGIDIIIGSMILLGNDDLGSKAWTPGNTNSFDYSLNGGGVYFGISPKLKGKTVGLTSDFAVGVFSFKEYLGIFNNSQEPFIDEYEKKTTGGFGAMSSVGGYLKFGKIGINPSLNAIYSGSSSASFLFWGFVFPVTVQF